MTTKTSNKALSASRPLSLRGASKYLQANNSVSIEHTGKDVARQNPDYQISRLQAKLQQIEKEYVGEIRGLMRPNRLEKLQGLSVHIKQLIQNIIGKHPEMRDIPIDETMLPPKPMPQGKLRARVGWRLIRAGRKGGKKAVPAAGKRRWAKDGYKR